MTQSYCEASCLADDVSKCTNARRCPSVVCHLQGVRDVAEPDSFRGVSEPDLGNSEPSCE